MTFFRILETSTAATRDNDAGVAGGGGLFADSTWALKL